MCVFLGGLCCFSAQTIPFFVWHHLNTMWLTQRPCQHRCGSRMQPLLSYGGHLCRIAPSCVSRVYPPFAPLSGEVHTLQPSSPFPPFPLASHGFLHFCCVLFCPYTTLLTRSTACHSREGHNDPLGTKARLPTRCDVPHTIHTHRIPGAYMSWNVQDDDGDTTAEFARRPGKLSLHPVCSLSCAAATIHMSWEAAALHGHGRGRFPLCLLWRQRWGSTDWLLHGVVV
eukprot:GGOE01025727.1.p1 GENE.GGOE01025727.1~~GGOE01025727.1.p1  ORF type:complete len:227 (-),score=7.43 GGOE01025727.1:307-987(-)